MPKYICGLVGIPTYKSDEIRDLPFCANDISRLKETLIKNLGIDSKNIQTLGENPKALISKVDILRIVNRLKRLAETEDTLILYYSGHGYSENNKGYITGFDTYQDFIGQTGISISWIKNQLDESSAKIKILIIDSCYSGMGTGKSVDQRMTKAFENALFLRITEGWVIFASCKQNELSYPLDDGSMSVFTYYLTKGLKGYAARNTDSTVSFHDLNIYITKNVKMWAIEHSKNQTPNFQMTLAGNLNFPLKKADLNVELQAEVEMEPIQSSKIILIADYISPKECEVRDDTGFPTGVWEEVSDLERMDDTRRKKSKFINKLFSSLLQIISPSNIEPINEKDFELPFGLFKDLSKNKFGYKFELHINRIDPLLDLTTLQNLLDQQIEFQWNSLQYHYDKTFDFDEIVRIVKERGYKTLDYNPMVHQLRIQFTKEDIADYFITFINDGQFGLMELSSRFVLSHDFFKTMPIKEILEIFIVCFMD